MRYEDGMSTSYPIRPIDDSEWEGFVRVSDTAFNSRWPREEMMRFDRLVVEPERTLVAFDGEQAVGTTLAFSFGMTVPGGEVVSTAGVSGVSVLPTYRRRGILSSLMRKQLEDVATGSEPLAALFASESAIYGRYGYGMAAPEYNFTLHRGDGQLLPLPTGTQSPPALRLAEPKAALAEMKAVYETLRPTRPGMLTRHDGWWNLHVADPEFMRDGTSPQACVIAEDSSGPRGYALYAVKPEWSSDGLPAQVLTLRELYWTDPSACAALWGDILTRDLVGEVRARVRPADDPILHLLADPRRARAHLFDGLYVRIVDLPAALMARTYAAAVDLVIDVSDDLLPGNQGRWRLQAGGPRDGGKPSCERTTAEADLTLPVVALGAAYLGGIRLGALAGAGQVTEHRPGAVAELSTAMWWDTAPWSPVGF
ncbi:MAG TPA: GNAT family N-acetyltransferase [Streptosporangiaceae bacterium]|nr:GNAT family N-acetyltransferase [Streptosporangiaceae bacterium]